jgi:hypothetical protein
MFEATPNTAPYRERSGPHHFAAMELSSAGALAIQR